MKKTFRYHIFQRLGIISIILPILIISYGFFQEAFPIENYLYSILCIVVSFLFAFIAIHILNNVFVKVIIEEKNLSVKRLYNSYSTKWEDMVEYGKDRLMVRPLYYEWKYYIKINGNGDKKFEICSERLKELKILNAHIIAKSKTAKLNNIEPGMIW